MTWMTWAGGGGTLDRGTLDGGNRYLGVGIPSPVYRLKTLPSPILRMRSVDIYIRISLILKANIWILEARPR